MRVEDSRIYVKEPMEVSSHVICKAYCAALVTCDWNLSQYVTMGFRWYPESNGVKVA